MDTQPREFDTCGLQNKGLVSWQGRERGCATWLQHLPGGRSAKEAGVQAVLQRGAHVGSLHASIQAGIRYLASLNLSIRRHLNKLQMCAALHNQYPSANLAAISETR